MSRMFLTGGTCVMLPECKEYIRYSYPLSSDDTINRLGIHASEAPLS